MHFWIILRTAQKVVSAPLRVGSASAERVGEREVGEVTHRVTCTWWLGSVQVTCSSVLLHCIGSLLYHKVVADGLNKVPTLAFIQGSRAASQDEICVITEVLTFLIINQVSSGFKIIHLIFSKCTYLN